MFSDVVGFGAKKFFENRGRNLNFPPGKPVKVQAGVKIESIAQSTVEENVDNIFIAAFKETIKDLEMQYKATKAPAIGEKLAWAQEYLEKYEKEIAQIRKAPIQPVTTNRTDHELKTLLANINNLSDKIKQRVINFPYKIVETDFSKVRTEIEEIQEQVRLYEQSIASYRAKGGMEVYNKISLPEKRLRTVYGAVAKRIEVIRDSLSESSDEKYELKQNLICLEQFADYLVKFAETEEIFYTVRTSIDREPIEKPMPAPERPEYQSLIDRYITELQGFNNVITELNGYLAQSEEIAVKEDITIEDIEAIILLDQNIKTATTRIDNFKTLLSVIREEAKEKYNVNIAELDVIKNFKVEKITYRLDYETYIENIDRKVIELTYKIQKLETSKPQNNEDREEESKNEMEQLYQCMMALNSMAEKRIIQHSRVHKKNINELYQKRHNRKQELIAEYEAKKQKDSINIEAFKKAVIKLREQWLIAIKKAPINRNGSIELDEKPYIEEMAKLIAQSHQSEELRSIMENDNNFGEERTQLIKNKHARLDELRSRITTRINMIFSSGTIANPVVEGIDYNEWLTEIEYSELYLLITAPEYLELIPNAESILKGYIDDQEKKYKSIKQHQQLSTIKKLSHELAQLIRVVDKIEIDDNFEEKIETLFEGMKLRYKKLKNFELNVCLEKNYVEISYIAKKYDFSKRLYQNIPQKYPFVIMSEAKKAEYYEKRGIKPEDQLQKPLILVENENVSDIKVTNRTIKLATNRRQVIDRAKNLIIKNADSLTVSLIKQGLKIRYNENLRNQLRALNAKLSLVNKTNYRSRKDIRFDGEATEQNLAFKTPKENFNIEDYKLEVRLVDDEKKKSDLLYNFDLANISDELHGKSK